MAYAPVNISNSSGSNTLGNLKSNYLINRALDQLRPNFVFGGVCDPDDIPKREGKQIMWYRGTNLAAATTGVAEGIVPTSLNLAPIKPITAIVTQYTDYINLTDILLATAPFDVMAKAADDLGFRAGYTVDNVTRGVIDAEVGDAIATALGTFLQGKDFASAGHILQGRNVPYFADGYYKAFTHPYTAFDVVTDPSAGGVLDVYKYTSPDKAGGISREDRGMVTQIGLCKLYQSTNVKATSGTPNLWRSYIFGKGGMGCASLAGKGPSKVTDPNKQLFKVNSMMTEMGVANPTGSIGGVVSYNFTYVAKCLQGGTDVGGVHRFQYVDTPSGIVA